MGSKKNLILASLASLVMVLAFAIGLAPTYTDGPGYGATAAPGSASVAISADGVKPVGDTFAIPVGSEQGFSALSLAGGAVERLLATGEVEWSLATDGSGALASAPGDLVATVKALAPGEAGLYVSTPDGLVDVVNITFYELGPKAIGDGLTGMEITTPGENSNIYIEQGTAPMLVLTSTTTDSSDTQQVEYALEATLSVYSLSSDTPPYAAVVPDITAIAPPNMPTTIGARAESVAAAGTFYHDTSTFMVVPVTVDADGSGLPDDPTTLEFNLGDQWRAGVETTDFTRQVAITPVMGPQGKAVPLYDDGTTVVLADPNAPDTRQVVVSVPSGVVEPGQEGLLVVMLSDTAEGLLGAAEAALLAPAPIGDPLAAPLYASVNILVRTVGETVYTNLAEVPQGSEIAVYLKGLGVPADDPVTLFSHPAELLDTATPPADPDVELVVNEAGNWVPASGGTVVDEDMVSGFITTLGVVSAFNTPDAPNIVSILNPNTSDATAFAIGGDTVVITLANLSQSDTVTVQIGGNPATIVNQVDNELTVTVPAADTPPNAPVESLAVDVTVSGTTAGTNEPFTDTAPGALTYVGPAVTSFSEIQATPGDVIDVTGAGFDPGLTVTVGGLAATSNVADENNVSFTVPFAPLGPADVTFTTENGFFTTVAAAFTVIPPAPVLFEVSPSVVPNDTSYTVYLSGSNFVAPVKAIETIARVYFTYQPGFPIDLVNDIPAGSVTVHDNSLIAAETPPSMPAGPTGVYVAVVMQTDGEETAVRTSNVVEITFVDPASAALSIEAVNPNSGPLCGGNEVVITGAGFPSVVIPSVKAANIYTGTVLRLSDADLSYGSNSTSVTMTLFRGPEQDFTESASSISGVINFDPTQLEYVDGSALASDNLLLWYGKTAEFNLDGPGQLRFVIFGGTREITTVDNERGAASTGAEENPFQLATLQFNVLDLGPGETAELSISELSMVDDTAAPLGAEFGPASESGFITMGLPDSILQIADLNIVPGATNAGIDLFLFRPAADQNPNDGPARVEATITYNTGALAFQGGEGSDLLGDWYGKGFSATETSPGVIDVVINETDTLITTFNNQNGPAKQDKVNPFPLGRLLFDVLSPLGTESKVEIVSLSMFDAAGAPILSAGSQDGNVTVVGAPEVYFGNQAATVLSSSNTEIRVRVPQGLAADAVDVRVVDPNNSNPLTNFAIAPAAYTYVEALYAITAISNVSSTANAGQAQAYSIGGEQIEITVSDLNEFTSASVEIGGKPAPVVSQSGNTIVVTVPAADPLGAPAASAETTITVSVECQGGEPSTAAFTYVGPTIAAINPATGDPSGGTPVTVTGEGFASGLTAELGGAALAGVAVADSTSFTGTTASHDAGTVDLVVTNPDNFQGTLAQAFVYATAGGQILNVTPVDPQSALAQVGGPFDPASFTYTVTNAGTDELTWSVTADVNWLDLTPANGTGDGSVTATFNANAALLAEGDYTATLSFTSNGGDETRIINLTVLPEGPVQIDTINPNQGPTAGGTPVTITGVGFGSGGVDTGPVITTGTVLRLADVQYTYSGSQVTVDMTLFRGPEQDLTEGAATINGVFTYDPTKLEFVDGVSSDLLQLWYGKQATFNEPQPGTVNFLIFAVNQTEITTVDNQISPTTDQENPFPLASLTFNVLDTPDPIVNLAITQVTMVDTAAAPLGPEFGVATQDGSVYVLGEALEPVVTFGNAPGDVTSFTDTEIQVLTPPGAPGFVNVRVVNPNLPGPNNFDLVQSGFQYIGAVTPELSVTPEAVQIASGPQGGPFSPSSFAYTVANTGTGDLNWQVTDDVPWLDVAPTSGSLVGGNTEAVTASLTAAADSLAPGDHTANIMFSSNGGNLVRQVVLTVTPEAVQPTLNSVFPDSVLTDGGYTVELLGADFVDPTTGGETQVWFTTATDPVQATSVTFLSSGAVEAVTPAHDAGTFEVFVRTRVNGSTEFLESDPLPFSFVEAGPVQIEAVTPNEGPLAGGNTVTITGVGFGATNGGGNGGGGDIETGTVLRLSDELFTSGPVTVAMSLFRGPEQDLNEGVATISGKIVYDPTVLQFQEGLGSDLLQLWYGKQASFNEPQPGTINFLIFAVNQTEITTVDNQISPTTDQENPFPIATLTFEVIGTLTGSVPLEFVDLKMVDSTAAELGPEFGAAGQNGSIFVEGAPGEPIVHFGSNPAQVLSFTDTAIEVVVPAGARGDMVDVRVENPNLPEPSNFDILPNGYTYIAPTGLEVSPTATQFVTNLLATNTFSPESVEYLVTNSGTGTLEWQVADDADWVTLSTAGGTGEGSVTATFQLTPTIQTRGTYTATLTFTSNAGTQVRTITLQVLDPTVDPILGVDPQGVQTITGGEGGPFTPSSLPYTVSNIGVGIVNWSVSDDVPWLEATPASGDVTPGNPDVVTVNVVESAAALLAPGTYTGTVTFTGQTNIVTRQVRLVVTTGGELTVTDITPEQFWLFGGVTATITGTGFNTQSLVYFGTTPAGTVPRPLPEPAEIVSVTDTQLVVIVPPLAGLGDPSTPLDNVPRLTVDVLVVNPDGPDADTEPDEALLLADERPDYVHFEVDGNIATTAFYLDIAQGTVLDQGDIALAQGAEAELEFPAFTAADIVMHNTAVLPSRIFGLARATLDEALFSLDQIDDPETGVAIPEAWEFDVHLYTGDTFPYSELDFSFNTAALVAGTNTAAKSARLTMPVDAGLTTAEIQRGQVSVFSIDTDLGYRENLEGITPPNANENAGFTASDPTEWRYESNIGENEFVAAGGNVTQVTARLYNFSAFALRRGTLPDVLAEASTIPDPADQSARTNENETIRIVGRSLNWATAVYFGQGPISSRDDLLDTSRFRQGTIVDATDFYIDVVTPDAPSNRNMTVDVYVVFPEPVLPTVKQSSGVPGVALVDTPFRWIKVIPRGLFALLFGLLIALIGLLAGGGGGGGGGPCFIATAAYGTPMAEQIDTLRVFRDTFLLSNPVGTAFADLYYHVSPALADVVAQSPILAGIVRVILVPVVIAAKVLVALPGVSAAVAIAGFGLLALRSMKRRSRKA